MTLASDIIDQQAEAITSLQAQNTKMIESLESIQGLSVIHDSIDEYLAPVTAKGTTEDEYVLVEASTLAWWMDAIADTLDT